MTKSRSLILLAATLLGFAAVGCGAQPMVSADGLPLKRVVVYRNGVGYFERAGRLHADQVTFRVKAAEVGDFLATLAVMEAGGSSVRSASFPLDIRRETEESPESSDELMLKPVPKPKAPDPNRLERVVLSLDGKEHDLSIGYVAVTPVWRPSYRLVVRNGKVDLQAWGIVQNLSGEDWQNVNLSLVAGAPLAFEASREVPITPDRPRVTDTGEVIAVVPQTETSLAQGAPAPSPAPSVARDEDRSKGEEADDSAEMMGGLPSTTVRPGTGAARGYGGAVGRASASPKKSAPARDSRAESRRPQAPPPPPPPPAPRLAGPSAPRNLSALAAVAVESGLTRYDIPQPISIPDKSATMVMLLSRQVPGELAFLFAPDPGVPASSSHPFRVARFQNATSGTLERGPIAIFEDGAFLGQGMVDQLPGNASTAVPFALERSLAIESSRQQSDEGARISKIEAGEIFIERDSVVRTTYKIRNGGDKLAKMLVKHARIPGSRLYQPPKNTEDNIGTGSALVPVEVNTRSTQELIVDERRANIMRVGWLDPLANEAVKAFLADSRSDQGIVQQLRAAWEIREKLAKATEDRQKLAVEQSELERNSQETRDNIKAIEKNKAAADLRAQLTQRLSQLATRTDQVSKAVIELDVSLSEMRIRFTESVRAIKLLRPPSPRD